MATKKAKVLEKIETTKKVKLEKEKDEIYVGKNFNKFSVGDMIEYEIKGPNFRYVGIARSEKSFFEENGAKNKSGFKTLKNEGLKKEIENIKFDYPYNFVSLGDPNSIERKPYLSSKGKNSGKLICKLINKTPIFTMGESKKDKNDHTEEYFLSENGKYIIPSSSIKGEVRNIVEVLTNSCIKNVEKEQLEKRLQAGKFKPEYGIIKRIPTSETSGLIKKAKVTKISREILKEIPEYYFLNKGKKELKEGFYNIKINKNIVKYETCKYDSKEKKYVNSIESRDEFEKIKSNGTEEAILWISSNIFNKHYEKILWDAKLAKDEKTYIFSEDEYKDLKYLINQRNERELKEGKKFYLDNIKTNEVIIFQSDMDNAINLTFSEIPRLRYSLSPLELVPKAFRPCDNIENLCFACRLFGSTGNQEGRESKNVNIACQGKVFFTDATIEKNKANIQSKPVTLKPLGEPHPSLVSFYLNNGDFDNKISIIRGRKFYWHHTDKLTDGKDVNKYLNSLKFTREKYNSSLQFMNPENIFDFEVRFENLTDEELGVLIYSLELEEGLLHKFGKAKAFGFGSSQILIDKFFLDSEDKYKSFVKTYDEGNKEKYVKIAKEKYIKNSRIEIKELKSILNKENSLNFKESPFPEMFDKKGNKNTLVWFTQMKKDKGFRLPKILEYK